MKTGPLFATVALSLLSACAGRQEVSVLAGRTSSILNDYRQEMSGFAQRQTTLRQDNQRRLRNLAQMREEHEGNVSRTLLGWQLANDADAIALYTLASRTDAAAIQAGSAALRMLQPAQSPVAAVRFDAAQVEAVVTRLRALQQPPTLWEQVAFGLAYSQALRDAYRSSIAKAGEEAAQSGSAAAAAAPPGPAPAPASPAPNN